MSRLSARCEWGHTPLSPGKNAVRNRIFFSVPARKDIVTLSPAALDVINTVRWQSPLTRQGRVLVIDMDPGAIEIANHIRLGDPANRKPGDYPHLKFLPEKLGDVREVLPNYYLSQFGAKTLGAIDLDLTGTVDQVIPIAQSIVRSVREHKHRRGVQLFVTYRNGRDGYGKNASERRIHHLAESLPGIKYNWHQNYRSDSRDRHLSVRLGSSMTVAAFKF